MLYKLSSRQFQMLAGELQCGLHPPLEFASDYIVVLNIFLDVPLLIYSAKHTHTKSK